VSQAGFSWWRCGCLCCKPQGPPGTTGHPPWWRNFSGLGIQQDGSSKRHKVDFLWEQCIGESEGSFSTSSSDSSLAQGPSPRAAGEEEGRIYICHTHQCNMLTFFQSLLADSSHLKIVSNNTMIVINNNNNKHFKWSLKEEITSK
jgi:hypothetical protein